MPRHTDPERIRHAQLHGTAKRVVDKLWLAQRTPEGAAAVARMRTDLPDLAAALDSLEARVTVHPTLD